MGKELNVKHETHISTLLTSSSSLRDEAGAYVLMPLADPSSLLGDAGVRIIEAHSDYRNTTVPLLKAHSPGHQSPDPR